MTLNYLYFKYLDRQINNIINNYPFSCLFTVQYYWPFVNLIDPQVMFVGDSFDQSTKYIFV